MPPKLGISKQDKLLRKQRTQISRINEEVLPSGKKVAAFLIFCTCKETNAHGASLQHRSIVTWWKTAGRRAQRTQLTGKVWLYAQKLRLLQEAAEAWDWNKHTRDIRTVYECVCESAGGEAWGHTKGNRLYSSSNYKREFTCKRADPLITSSRRL